MSWTVRTVCIAMLRNEGLIYDICKFYFLGTWSFWTTSTKQTGHQNSRTHKLCYNTSLFQAEFQFFKGLIYDSKLLLLQKMLLRVIITQSSRWTHSLLSLLGMWLLDYEWKLQEKCLRQVILFTSTQTERKWLTSRFSTVFDFVMRYKYIKTPFFCVVHLFSFQNLTKFEFYH